MITRRSAVVLLCFIAAGLLTPLPTGADQPVSLPEQLSPLLSCLSGSNSFSLSADIEVSIDDQPQQVKLRFARHDDEQFDLVLEHRQYAVDIRRRGDSTSFALPRYDTVYFATGDFDAIDNLAPNDASTRLVSSGSILSMYLPLIQDNHPEAVSRLITGLLKLRHDPVAGQWHGESDLTLEFSRGGKRIAVTSGTTRVDLQIDETTAPLATTDWSGMKRIELTREELERQLARGVRRSLEILAPSPMLTSPPQKAKKVLGGELRWIDGQRVVLLHGTPQQIGRAHGQVLEAEATRCIDSVLYAFGTVQTIRTGRWFRHDLDAAYARLAPHIPEDHRTETRALASALELDSALVESLNVFPELFHCSGFALFGSATKDGKLYHGRVLDYMTTIGLQDSATTFIVAVDGKIPFANVGYAGFIGSVTGMNAKSISLGEMGGGGEGQWDGVPMATLMRRALEECSTLEEVKQLWQRSPRTCEYFYVFADGKTNQAVGVAALPESIEFIEPGQSHERLGEGIADAVVLSAGDRLQTLRERVKSRHGQIDASIGQWLMSRPVAMQSNLHNALFVPADGVFYVAAADHQRPAAECNYVRYDFNALLKSIQPEVPVAAVPR